MVLRLIMGVAFALTIFTTGKSLGPSTITPAAFLLCLGFIITVVRRMIEGKPLVPAVIFKNGATMAILAYILIGLVSGLFAGMPHLYGKEIIQRFVIIVAPIYLMVFGPRTLKDIQFTFLSFLPAGTFVSLVAFSEALHMGFARPVTIFELHKNEIGASCATQAIICAAFLQVSQSKRRKILFATLLALSLAGILAAQARASLLSLVAGALLMLIAGRAKLVYLAGFAGAVVVGLAAVVWALPSEVYETAVSLQEHSSNATRLNVWSAVFERLLADPFALAGWGNPIVIRGELYLDTANVLLYDWMQLGLVGLLALLVMMLFCIKLPLDNARRLQVRTLPFAINQAALGIIVARFLHAMLDTFWVGRGQTLTTFVAVGVAIFIKLLLDQVSENNQQKRHVQPSSKALARQG